MGIDWIQTNSKNEQLTFLASVDNWPSSTRTEVLAIISAILDSPPESKIIILSDMKVYDGIFFNEKVDILVKLGLDSDLMEIKYD
nr:12932_t:CDS:2 [Entrophospora candida]